jgi:hypothetical protein
MASFAHRGSDGLLMAGRVAHLFHSDAKNSDSVWNFSINVGMAPKHSKMRYYIMDLEKLFGLSDILHHSEIVVVNHFEQYPLQKKLGLSRF